MANIYRYHEITKDYLGISQARIDPVNSNKYSIPAHATLVQPPKFTPSLQTCRFYGSAWVVAPKTVSELQSKQFVVSDGQGQVPSENVINGVSNCVCLENLTAGDFVHVTENRSVQKACANDALNIATGFVISDFVSETIAKVYGPGQINTALSGLVAGTTYYLDPVTPGAVTATKPTSPNAIQVIGAAISPTALPLSNNSMILPDAASVLDRIDGKWYRLGTANGVPEAQEA